MNNEAMKLLISLISFFQCIQYIDTDVLKDLMPKVVDLIKCSVGFGTKIACSHFLILLSTHLKAELQPYSGNNVYSDLYSVDY